MPPSWKPYRKNSTRLRAGIDHRKAAQVFDQQAGRKEYEVNYKPSITYDT